jgi:hypothetical protein
MVSRPVRQSHQTEFIDHQVRYLPPGFLFVSLPGFAALDPDKGAVVLRTINSIGSTSH